MTTLWTENAIEHYNEIADFLEENVSLRASQKFVEEVWDLIFEIKKHPLLGGRQSLKDPNVLTRLFGHRRHQWILYYSVTDSSSITIVDIWSTKRNPTTRPF